MRTAAVIGAGPSGLHAARALLSCGVSAIDVYDALPEPFGLARWGVAPDHSNGAKAMRELTPVLSNPAISFIGSTRFGSDITREQLLERYDAIIYAFGCEQPRRLDVPGKELAGVFTADQLYHWYTGTPGTEALRLSGTRDAVVVGGGDTANDVARLLLLSNERLDALELPAQVRGELRATEPTQVRMLIRGGLGAIRFKPRDLPGLVLADGIQVRAENLDATLPDDASPAVQASAELIRTALAREIVAPRATLTLCFHTELEEILGDTTVSSIRVRGLDAPTAPAQLVVEAMGFQRSNQLANLPLNDDGTITTSGFQVHDSAKEFAVGWARRGASGGFGTCRREGDDLAAVLAALS